MKGNNMSICEVKIILTDKMIEQLAQDMVLKVTTDSFHPEVDMIDKIALMISRELKETFRNLLQ